MKTGNSFRGTSIDSKFADEFKKTKFHTDIYCQHKDEIIIGIRDEYINLYYNCKSIAKISSSNSKFCEIASKYTGNKKKLTDDELLQSYYTIKHNIDIINDNEKQSHEKQAQEKLFIDNNCNSLSNWYCIDIEYVKSLQGMSNSKKWRFDIIAITKKAPFKVALIELKYGSNAIGGKSGIRSHVHDFYEFFSNDYFNKYKIRGEVASIINSLDLLGVDIPESLKEIKVSDIQNQPDFYFITLDNNPEKAGGSTPMQTMDGYLFGDNRWGSKKISKYVSEDGDFYQITNNDPNFKPTFLFSDAVLPNLHISDILDLKNYEVKTV